MFDDTAAFLIFTGRIMRRNGLYMIVLSGEGTGIQGKRRNARVYVCVCISVTSVYVSIIY